MSLIQKKNAVIPAENGLTAQDNSEKQMKV